MTAHNNNPGTNQVTVWFLYPETKGLTLEEIDTLFIKDRAVTHTLTEKAEEVHHLEENNKSQH